MIEPGRSTGRAKRKATIRVPSRGREDVTVAAPAQWVTDQPGSPSVEGGPLGERQSALDKLYAERQRLLKEIQEQDIPLSDHPTTLTHMADDASDIADQMTARALRRHLEEQLEEVERAMARAERGDYGVCERCGGPVSAERLAVLPSTTLCIGCAHI